MPFIPRLRALLHRLVLCPAITDTVSFMPPIACLRLVPLVLIAAASLAPGDARAQRGGVEVSSPARPATVARTTSGVHARNAEQRALSAAVRRVESQTGGQVLSAERIPFDGRDVSRIKVVDASGRVRVYMDDPQTARSGRGGIRAERAPTRDDDN